LKSKANENLQEDIYTYFENARECLTNRNSNTENILKREIATNPTSNSQSQRGNNLKKQKEQKIVVVVVVHRSSLRLVSTFVGTMIGQLQANGGVEHQQQRRQQGQSVISVGMKTDTEQDKENDRPSVPRSRRFFWKLGKRQPQPIQPTKAPAIKTAIVATSTPATSTTINASNPVSISQVPAVTAPEVRDAPKALLPVRVVASTSVPSSKPVGVGSSLPPGLPCPKATSSTTASTTMASLTNAATTSLTTFQDIQDMTRELQASLFGQGSVEASTALDSGKSSECSTNNNNNENSSRAFLCLLEPFCSEESPITNTKDMDDDDIRVQFYPTMSTTTTTTTPKTLLCLLEPFCLEESTIITTKDVDDDDVRVQFYPTMSIAATSTTPKKKHQRQGPLPPTTIRTPPQKQSPTSVLEKDEFNYVLRRTSDVFDSLSDGKEPEEDSTLSSLWMSAAPSPQRVVHLAASAAVASECGRGCSTTSGGKPAPDTTVSRPLPPVTVKAQPPSMRSSALPPKANKKSLTTATSTTTTRTPTKTTQHKKLVASKSRRGTHVKPLPNAQQKKEENDASASTCSNSCDSDNHPMIASVKRSNNIKNKKDNNKVPQTAAMRVPPTSSSSSSASSSAITDLVWSVLEGVWNFTQDEVAGFDDNGTIDNYTMGGHDEEEDSSNLDSMDSQKEGGDGEDKDENENVVLLVEPPIGSFIDTLGWQDEDIYNFDEQLSLQGGRKEVVPRTRRRRTTTTTRTRKGLSSDEDCTSILATHSSQSQPPGLEGLLTGLCKL
jgi:hypothetical protein